MRSSLIGETMAFTLLSMEAYFFSKNSRYLPNKKFKKNSQFVGSHHVSDTVNLEEDKMKTDGETLINRYVKSSRMLPASVSDNTVAAGALGTFIRNTERTSAKSVKKQAITVIELLEMQKKRGAKIGQAAVYRDAEPARFFVPVAVRFDQTGKRMYL